MRLRDTLLASVAAIALASPALAQLGFRANLSGAAENPPVSTTATGTGTIIMTGTTIQFNVSFSGLQGNFSATHIHGPALPTANAGVFFNWGVAPYLTLAPGNRAGTIIGSFTLSATNAGHIQNGLAYMNVHSQFAPGGELRGQIFADQTVATQSTSWGRIKGLYR